MKKILLLIIVSICFMDAGAIAVECNNLDEEDIELGGDLSGRQTRSLMKPIAAFKDANFIQANFLANLGTITIYIYDEYGDVVSQQSVSTFAGQQVSIDITFFSSGEYTIAFVNSQNRYLSGNFEI